MPAFPELFVLRHGETAWNVEGRMQGALNSPLTEKGKAQAARQGVLLRDVDLTGFQIICSPQARAFETAAIALAGQVAAIRTDPQLREIGVGAWAGKLRNDLVEHSDFSNSIYGVLELYEHAPEGEGFAGLEQRCAEFLSSLTGPAVLITHGITSRMIRAIVTKKGRAGVPDIGGGQGVVYHLKNDVQKRLE